VGKIAIFGKKIVRKRVEHPIEKLEGMNSSGRTKGPTLLRGLNQQKQSSMEEASKARKGKRHRATENGERKKDKIEGEGDKIKQRSAPRNM